MACAVRVPASVCGRGGATSINNSLRCARACLGLNSGWGNFYHNGLRCARAAASVCGRGGALFKEMLRPKGSLGPMVKVIPR